MRHATPQPTSRGAAFVSWMLLFMSVGTFTPCVLLPEWRDYRVLQAAKQAEEQRLASVRQLVEGERRLLEALRSDPTVNERLAQRELRFKALNARAVLVSGKPDTGPWAEEERYRAYRKASLRLLPNGSAGHLPDYPYGQVFCGGHTRRIVMVMSVALMLVALCLPSRGHPACRNVPPRISPSP